MTVLLQISDPHFGTEQAPVVEALVALARQQRPDLLVLSGDITQRARPAQFRAARSFMDRLGGPLLAIPGNHDIPLLNLWARWKTPYAQHCAAFGAELEPVFRSADVLVIGVNTTRAYRHANGEVSPAQIDRVASLLAGATAAQVRGNQHDEIYDRVDDNTKQDYRQNRAKQTAAAGAVVGGSRQRQERRAQEKTNASTTSTAYTSCLQGKGYQVNP